MIWTSCSNIFCFLKRVISLPQSLCRYKLHSVSVCDWNAGSRRFATVCFTKIHSNDSSENQRPKISENYKNLKKMCIYKYHKWCKETGLPNRDESFPQLPSKPVSIVRKTAVFTFIAFISELNPLKPELNPICYLQALLGAHHFLHVSRIRVKSLIL